MYRALAAKLRFPVPSPSDVGTRLRENGWWFVFLAALVLVGVGLTVKLPPIMRAAALSTAERGVFADYLCAALLAAVLGALLLVAPIEENDKGRLLFLWTVKAAVTLFFLPVYEAHYAALDARGYFAIGAFGIGGLPSLSFGDGTSVTTWLIHWATLLLPAYFHMLEMLWSFVGLAAIYAFYRGWRWLAPELDSRFLLWIGLFPSILFWSSILGKDPPVLLGIGLYFYGVARWSATREIRLLALAAVGVLLASAIRPWLAIILAAPLVAFPLTGRELRGWQKLALLIAVGIGIYFAAGAFIATFKISSAEDLVQTSNAISHSWASGGSAVQHAQFHGPVGLIKFLPLGMFTALFRPLPWDAGNVFGMLAAAVNVVLLGMLVRAITRTPLRALRSPRLLWIVLLIAVWAALYAFPSSQNLGTAVRFQLQILPVLWPLFIVLGSRPPKPRARIA